MTYEVQGEVYPWWEAMFLGKATWVYYLGISGITILSFLLLCVPALVLAIVPLLGMLFLLLTLIALVIIVLLVVTSPIWLVAAIPIFCVVSCVCTCVFCLCCPGKKKRSATRPAPRHQPSYSQKRHSII